MTDIEKFIELYDFGNIKQITPSRIDVRCRNLEYGIAISNRIINKHKLKLKVKSDAEMAAYNAFEIVTS